MRIQLAGLVAAMGLSLTACASAPRHDAGATDVPMYTNAEWAKMNAETSVPEIPANEVGTAYVPPTQAGGYVGASGHMGFNALAGYGFGGSQGYSSGSVFSPSYGRSTVFAGNSGSGSSFSGHASFGGGLGHASAATGGNGGARSTAGGHSSGGHSGGH